MNENQALIEAYVAVEQVASVPDHEAGKHLIMLQAIRERADRVIRDLERRKRSGQSVCSNARMTA